MRVDHLTTKIGGETEERVTQNVMNRLIKKERSN